MYCLVVIGSRNKFELKCQISPLVKNHQKQKHIIFFNRIYVIYMFCFVKNKFTLVDAY